MDLDIVCLGDFQLNDDLLLCLEKNYPFIYPRILYEDEISKYVDEKGKLYVYYIVNEFIEREDKPRLILTNQVIYTIADMFDSDDLVEIEGGGFSYFVPPHRIAMASTKDNYNGIGIARKTIHEIGHWFTLTHHEEDPKTKEQCPMVISENLSDGAQLKETLCNSCQNKLNSLLRKTSRKGMNLFLNKIPYYFE